MNDSPKKALIFQEVTLFLEVNKSSIGTTYLVILWVPLITFNNFRYCIAKATCFFGDCGR